MYKNTIAFTGGINTDDDLTILPSGDYTDAFYSRNLGGVQGASSQLQSVTGNLLIANSTLPSGTNKVIGACAYTEANSTLYFVYNSSNNHCIFMVNNLTNAVTKVAQSSVFNFKQDYKIFSAFVIDNKLYWTDGYFVDNSNYLNNNWNGGRRLDIPWAIGGGTITREAIAWDIYQPWRSPLAVYDTDNTVPANYLVGKLFQFRYQWVYRTKEESVWSPISKMPISENGYFTEGIRSLTTIVDNVIRVTIYTGSSNVTDLRVAYREGNAGEFRVFKELNKANSSIGNDTTYVVEFTKDEFIYTLPNTLKNNELLPRVFKCAELLPTNEAAFANALVGYNKEQPDVKIFPQYEEIDDVNGLRSTFQIENYYPNETFVRLKSNDAPDYFPYNKGDVIVLQIYSYISESSPTEIIKYPIPTQYTQTTVSLRYTALISDFAAYLTGLGYTVTINAYGVGITDYFSRQAERPTSAPDPTIGYVQCLHPAKSQKTYKTGALHQFAIQYYDNAQKDGTVWRGVTSSIRVPTVAELNTDLGILPAFTNPRAPFRVWFQYKIGKDYLPPVWATHYQVMYKPPRIDFQQRVIKGVSFLSDGRVRITLDDFYLNNYQGATIQMQIQIGDSVRFIRKANNEVLIDPVTGTVVNYMAQYAENNAELIVYGLGTGSDGAQYIDVDNIGLDAIFRPNGTPINGNISNGTIEIYRSSAATDDDPWYEVGETWEIGNPNTNGRYHKGDVDQNPTFTEAVVNLNGGDCYLKKRPQGYYYPATTSSRYMQMCWMEDPAFSDYFVSNYSDYGRIGIEDLYAEQKTLKAMIGHTGQYIDNTRVNRMNQVDFENVTYLREEQGSINRIIINGFTLTCLQDRKNTSIYIQRTMSVDGVGGSNIILTDKTFGGVRPLEEDWGTVHSGSVIKADNNVFFYDYINATWVATTGGGQLDVAKKTKFSKGAYDLTQILTPTSFMCAAISKNFSEAHWYAETTDGQKLTYVYNFKDNRWKFKMNHAMDFQSASGQFHYSFLNGALYKENAGTELTFMGNLKQQSVNFVFNLDPTTVKFYLNLWLQTNVLWDVPYISVPPSLNAPTGMLSHLVKEQFKPQEGYIVAGYRKDESDPAFEYPEIAYVEGRRLMGYIIQHNITYSGTTKSYLLNAAVNFGVSMPMNK